MGGTSMKDVGGAVLAGSSPPFPGRERAAVDVDVGPERRSPRYHETCLALESVDQVLKKAVRFACSDDDDDVDYYIRWRLPYVQYIMAWQNNKSKGVLPHEIIHGDDLCQWK